MRTVVSSNLRGKMAAEQNGEVSESSLQNLTICEESNVSLSDGKDKETIIVNEPPYKFGFGVTEFYKLCLKYYHKEKKIIRISYDDKLQLTAFWKQACCGPFDLSKGPEVGYFDVIGNDRRRAWEELGEMSKVEAMKEFCRLLEKCSPELVPWMEAQQKEREEQERLRREEEDRKRREAEEAAERERQRLLAEEEARRKAQEEEEEERRRQEELQREEEERIRHSQQVEQQAAMFNDQNKPAQINGTPRILPASLWTRPKVQEFIQHVKSDPSSVLVVGRGETMTVRVPTHDSGTCLFWEFATEYYDLGFGVNFEWSQADTKNITVEVNESDDQDSEVNEDDEKPQNADGGVANPQAKIRVDEILPVIRRPCNDEVIVGSHMYPGKGVYLLKFDNSYSLFRSKTLYYRVYYTR